MNAQVTVETINPKTASEWLENKWEEQRPIRANHVTRLAAEIKNSNFRLTSDAIVLVKGRLANGQHRLSAVVESGKNAPFIVMRSNDEELYKIIDCGIGRSLADAIYGSQYAKCIAAATRLVLVYDSGLITSTSSNAVGSKKTLTRGSVLDYIEKHKDALAEQSSFIYSLYSQSRITATSISTAFLHIASRKTPEKAREFITNVYTGEAIDSSKDFRDRMIKQMGSKGRFRQEYVFALLIKAWKSFKNGTRPGTLKIADGEVFPQI